MIIVAYNTIEEAEQIIIEKKSLGYILIEIANIAGGKFLAFRVSNEMDLLQIQNIELINDSLNQSEIILDLGIRIQMLEMGV